MNEHGVDVNAQLRARIKQLFRERGMSPKRHTGADNVVKGRSLRPQFDTLKSIADFLDVPLDAITGEKPRMTGIVSIPFVSVVDIDRGLHQAVADNPAQPGLMLPMEILEGLATASLRAFEVVSDSMEPELRQGDTVIADLSSMELSGGGIFLVHDSTGFAVYRIMPLFGSGRAQLISDNSRYPTQETKLNELRIVGRVVRSIRIPR